MSVLDPATARNACGIALLMAALKWRPVLYCWLVLAGLALLASAPRLLALIFCRDSPQVRQISGDYGGTRRMIFASLAECVMIPWFIAPAAFLMLAREYRAMRSGREER